MIPDIGIIIAAYVITRMALLVGTPTAPLLARILAVITVLVTLAAGVDLFARSLPAIR
ncbi:MAG: hypothetical protein WB678_02185 [Stellaceae bacterium]